MITLTSLVLDIHLAIMNVTKTTSMLRYVKIPIDLTN